jgi:glycosyltransferase involved in cell wall biosynthesis
MRLPSREWLTLQWQLIRPYARYVYYKVFPRRRPPYFDAPWAYPGDRLDHARDLPAPDPRVCIFLPMNDWHARIQRSQQLAKAIADQGGQAVYANPHLGLEYRLPYYFDPHTRIAKLAPRLFELHVHLPREHELGQRALTGPESSRVAREIGRLIDSAGIRKAALIVSFPAWLDAAEQLRRRYGFPIVYDCHDWLPGFERIAPALLDLETALFSRSDLVVFSSQRLQERVLERCRVGGGTVLLRNAVEPVAAAPPLRPDNPRRVPTIGYVGALDHWFDVEAVASVAREHPAWRIVLAGRVEDQRVLELRQYPNVSFIGEVPYAEVAALLSGWDAGMIPFLVNDLTLATNPIKLYEYFCAGLPVVSTRLPEVELYGELVYLAHTPQAFSAQASEAIREQDADLRGKRIETARRETWPARAERLLEYIGSLGEGKPAKFPPPR